MKSTDRNKLVNKLISKKAIKTNASVFRAFDIYEKTSELLERANLASGKQAKYQTSTSSTADSTINTYGISSTQKI